MAQFPLKINGAEVCTLEDLKKNFNPDELVSYRGRFTAWLKGWDYDEEAVAIKALDQNLCDKDWVCAVCKIIGISDQELEVSRKKSEETARREQKNTIVKQNTKKTTKKNTQESNPMQKVTKDNISIEILTETAQKIPDCGTWGDSFFVVNNEGWFFSPTSYTLFQSHDYGKSWKKISYNGNKIFHCNNHWITAKDDGYIKFSDDLYEWREVPGPNLAEKDRIFFDGSVYIAVNALRNGCYNIWKSEDIKTWKKIKHYESHYHDFFFHDGCYYLLEKGFQDRDFILCKAASIDELCRPPQNRIMQNISEHNIGRFIAILSGKAILNKNAGSREDMVLSVLNNVNTYGFWVTDDFENYISYDGTATVVENLILCCDKTGFWVSQSGKQKSWRKLDIKLPFAIDRIVYQNGILLMYGSDCGMVCAANIYTREIIDKNKC